MTESDDPIKLAIAGVAAGTGIGIKGTLEQGKQVEKIAKQRAAVDIASAEATEKTSIERAKIRRERGRRTLATQKSEFAAGNIRLNVGAPLVVEAETRDIITQDVGFILEGGRTEADFFRSRAGLERAAGKVTKRKSRFSAISQGLLGFGNLAFKGKQAGFFNKKIG